MAERPITKSPADENVMRAQKYVSAGRGVTCTSMAQQWRPCHIRREGSLTIKDVSCSSPDKRRISGDFWARERTRPRMAVSVDRALSCGKENTIEKGPLARASSHVI